MVETQDRFGKKVSGRLPLQVLQPEAPALGIKIPNLVAAPDWEIQPGREFTAVWGTGYAAGRAFIEIEQRGKFLQRFWTAPGRTQQQIKLAVTEAMRGGFTLHVTQVRENRGYLTSRQISVPWKNQELELKWEHFVSKLTPGQKETWTLQIRSPKSESHPAEKAAAELVATLYDESLDAFAPRAWPDGFGVFRQDYSTLQAQFGNTAQPFQLNFNDWNPLLESVEISYRHFPPELTQHMWSYGWRGMRTRRAFGGGIGGGGGGGAMSGAFKLDAVSEDRAMLAPAVTAAMAPMPAGMAAKMPPEPAAMAMEATGPSDRLEDKAGRLGANPPKPDLSQVSARKNLNETAFFFPQLTSDSNGIVRLTFTMPEALTQWRFLGFAHDQHLRAGLIEAHAVTAKDIMVQPNPPRFLREGDTLEFSVKISN